MQRPMEHGLTAEEAVAQAQAEGLVLSRSDEGNSGFVGVEHVRTLLRSTLHNTTLHYEKSTRV